MAEGTYEYECSRAELLGVSPPSRADWEAAEEARRESQLAEQMTEIDIQDEKINEGTSKMEEITNILSMTQMRLNKFKIVCGSLTNLLKIRGTGDGTDEESAEINPTAGESSSNAAENPSGNVAAGGAAPSQPDVQKKMSRGIDKLDSLLTKTENAQYSMAHQSQQMKSFMK